MLSSRKMDQCANHYAKIMVKLGIDVKSEHSKDTPMRVVKMLAELTQGLRNTNPPKLTTFTNTGDQLVIVAPIPFSSMCSHHHVAFTGYAAVGYLPDKLIVGISKFKRVIDYFSAKPQTQEVLVNEVAKYLYEQLKPKALYVYMKAHHACMGSRGVKTPCSQTITHAAMGKLALDNVLKSEFLSLIANEIPKSYV